MMPNYPLGSAKQRVAAMAHFRDATQQADMTRRGERERLRPGGRSLSAFSAVARSSGPPADLLSLSPLLLQLLYPDTAPIENAGPKTPRSHLIINECYRQGRYRVPYSLISSKINIGSDQQSVETSGADPHS